MTTFIGWLFLDKITMTKTKRRLGCLTNSMIQFLYMSEKERRNRYGYDVNAYYKRIVDSVDRSFQDVMIAFSHLPENQRGKIDLITNYDAILRQIRRRKLSADVPDTAIKSTILELENTLDFIAKRDRNLRKMVEPDFEKVIKWLRYIEKKPKEIGALT